MTQNPFIIPFSVVRARRFPLTASIISLVLLSSLFACTPTNPTPSASPSPTSSAVEPSPTVNPLTANGLGPIQIGMTLEDVTRVLGAPLVDLNGQPLPSSVASESCFYGKSDRVPGVELMLNQGVMVRLDLATGSTIKTAAGVGLGSSPSAVESAYGGQVQVTPHKYVPGGQYLTVTPPDQPDARIVFETDGKQVTAIRAGRTPEVELVERCG